MKRILYDMGHLIVTKWLLQRALKFNIPFCPRSPPKIKKKKFVLKRFLGNFKGFKLIFFSTTKKCIGNQSTADH